jgi:hypothetical protein
LTPIRDVYRSEEEKTDMEGVELASYYIGIRWLAPKSMVSRSVPLILAPTPYHVGTTPPPPHYHVVDLALASS